MSPRELHLLEARRRARSIRSARSEVMRRAAIQRLLFELREALRPAPKKVPQ
jgi:hypothetical protein